MAPRFPQSVRIGNIPVLVETSDGIPLLHVTLALRQGSAIDPVGQEGLARLTARLMRRTAGGMPLADLERRLDRLGISLSADTSYSNMSQQATCLLRSSEPCVSILAETLGQPALGVDEFARLQREALAETMEGQDNDRSLVSRALRRHLFAKHAYGRSVTGTLASLHNIGAQHVRPMYERLCRRGDLVIGITGNIDQASALRLAQSLIESVPLAPASPDTISEPLPLSGRRLVFVDKPERSQTQIYIGLHGAHPQDEDHLELHLANAVFGGMFSSRLMQQIRVRRGWSYSAYSSLPLDRHRQAFTLWTAPKAEDAAACLKLELQMIEDLVAHGISAKELAAAKNMLTRSYAFLVDSAAKRVGLALDELLYDLPAGYYASYPKRIRGLSLPAVNAALHRRLDPRHLVVAVVGTSKRLFADLCAAMPEAETQIIPFDAPDL
jgi:zinc protease